MAKKQATGKLSPGTRVRVKPGVTIPEFPDVSCAGWTGTVAELVGKKTEPKYIVEWDEATLRQMPPSYVKECERRNLFYRMACLGGEDLEPAE